MATIANLSIGLSADSARLKKDLDKADAATKKWGNKQKKTFAGVAKSVKGIAVAIAAIGASAMALRGMSTLAKEITNLSTLTNMSTTELQRLDPALSSIGMSTEKYADIIKDVNDKMHDFLQTGGGPMKDFFEQIAPKVGITADAFKGLSGKEGLQLYVDSLEKAGASQEQMTFYMEAIASDSTMLLPLLRNQSAEMLRLGLATDQVIKGSVLADLNSLGVQIQAIALIVRNSITNALGPLISVLADAVEGWRQLITQAPIILRVLGAITAAIGLLTAYMLASPITIWITAIALLITGVGWLAKKFFELAEVVGSVSELWTLMREAAAFEFERIGAAASLLGNQMKMIFWGIKDQWNQMIGQMSISFAELLDSVAGTGFGKMMGMEGGNASAAVGTFATKDHALLDEWILIDESMREARGKLGAENPFTAQIKDALTVATESFGGSGKPPASKPLGSGGKGSDAAKKAADAAAKKAAEKAAKEAARIKGIGDAFIDGVADSFASALKTGDWKGFLKDTLDSFTSDVISNFAKGLFAPLKDFMSDAIGALMNSLSAGDGKGGIWGSLSTIFSGVKGAADGGIVPTTPFSKSYADSVPTMLQPGELVVPKSQVDNFLSGAGGSGGGQTFNINVSGDVSRQTRSEIVAMMPQIAAGTNMLNKENGIR